VRFHKYHAAGNDFIVTADPAITPSDAPRLCDRHTGIGADGILLHRGSTAGDARMIVVNADGSVAEMCGNGLRCFCRYLIEQCVLRKERITVETGKGLLTCDISRSGARWIIAIDLGPAAVTAEPAPGCWHVDVGNPHLVVSGISDEGEAIREALRLQQGYEGKINVEMILSFDRSYRAATVIVNERGAGFTRSCGTGGAAVVAALRHAGIVAAKDEWTIRFPGGDIRYRFTEKGTILMSGDAHFVFSGDTDVPPR